MRVLIVEGNLGDAALLSRMLRSHGYCQIEHATSLQSALKSIASSTQSPPEVILLDLMLADGDGLASLLAIRAAAPAIATVVLTALENDALALQAVREGAQDYVVKGQLVPDALDRAIRHAVERERIRNQAIGRESLLRLAYGGTSVVPWEWDIQSDIIRVGPAMVAHPARGRDGFLTKRLARVHPQDLAGLEREAQRCIDQAGAVRCEYRMMAADGSYRWQQLVMHAQADGALPAAVLVGVSMDVHRRRVAEETLTALSQGLASRFGPEFLNELVLHLTRVLGVRWALVARVDGADAAAAELVALAEQDRLCPLALHDLRGSPCADALAFKVCYVRDGVVDSYPNDTMLADMGVVGYSGLRLQDSKGRFIGLMGVMHDQPLPEDGDAILQTLSICSARVAAELERMAAEKTLEASEARLRQAHKMEAIGKLASGIAHDFTNLLTAVRGHASLATATLGPDHPALENLKQLEEAARQASGVANSLLTFARRSRPDILRVSLLPILESSVMLFRSMTPPDVPLDLDLAEARGVMINADETQIRQMLINLMTNAADAVAIGGRVSLSAKRVPTGTGNGAIALCVGDTGVGIESALHAQIFEPFFSTKAQGNGLGLAVVHGVITEHGWKLELDSERGRGARFTVSVPIQDLVADSLSPASESYWTSKLAMVIMRSRLPRGLVAGALAESGLDVLQAADEREGTTILRDCDRDVDLLVLDTPDGWRWLPPIWNEIIGRSPNAKCIVVGGDLPPIATRPGILSITRPFQLGALKHAMARLARPVQETPWPAGGAPSLDLDANQPLAGKESTP